MKTAQELNITAEEHLALQAVAAGLASGQYVHRGDGEKVFNMNIQCTSTECGTVGCIGGWVGIEMGMSVSAASEYVECIECEGPLERLYYPVFVDWLKITPTIAAEGIYNFLDTGDPDFKTLLAAPDIFVLLTA